jgi:MFS family permease
LDWKYDFSTENSLVNWITELNLLCVDPYEVGLIGSLHFFGMFAGSILLIHLSDIFGRRLTLLVGGSIYYVCSVYMFYVTSLQALYWMSFFQGFFALVRASSSYMMAMEYVPERYRSNVALMIYLVDGSSYIVTALGLSTFKTFRALLPLQITGAFGTLTVVLFILPESPFFWHSQSDYPKLKASLKTIARWNQVDEDKIDVLVDKLEQVETKRKL